MPMHPQVALRPLTLRQKLVFARCNSNDFDGERSGRPCAKSYLI